MARLESELRALEARVALLEGERQEASRPSLSGEAPAPVTAATPSPAAQGWDALGAVPALAGRTLLVLAGAYLIRALAESAVVPAGPAVGLGLLYAGAWLLAADRDARLGLRGSAMLHGLASAAIAYPLTWEAKVRFGLATSVVAGLLVAVSLLLMAVAARRDLRVTAWCAAVGAPVTAIGLAVAAAAPDVFGLALIVVGIAAYALDRRLASGGLAWLPAAGADFLVGAAAFVALRPEGLPESYRPSFLLGALLVGATLPVVYLATFAVGARRRGRLARAFELAQGGAVLVLASVTVPGLTARAGAPPALVGALAVAGGFLALDVAFREAAAGRTWNEGWFGVVALAAVFGGASLLLGRPIALLAACVAAVLLALVRSHGTPSLLAAAAVAWAAAASGLLTAWGARLAGGTPAGATPELASAAVIATAAAAGLLMSRAGLEVAPVAGNDHRAPGLTRDVASLLATVVALLGIAAEVVTLVLRFAPERAQDAAWTSALRTVVIAAAAVALAALAAASRWRVAGWLTYAALALGAAKLLVDDLPHGRASTLVVGLAAYGSALLLAPRLRRTIRGASTERA